MVELVLAVDIEVVVETIGVRELIIVSELSV